MGVVTGSISIATSEEDVAYSEDPDVVAGESRVGCGWCPPDEFEKVGEGADVVTSRTLNDKERTHYRDVYARVGPASANLYACRTSVRCVQTRVVARTPNVPPKRVRLEGAKAIEWVQAVARTNPVALDLLADRVIHRTNGRDPAELFDDCRRVFGLGPLEEVSRADGDSKSEPAAG